MTTEEKLENMRLGRIQSARHTDEKRSRFIVRRAFTLGRASSGDVCDAFDVSRQTGTDAIKHALLRYDEHLTRAPGVWHVESRGAPPAWASLMQVIEALLKGEGYAIAGVRPEEIGLLTRIEPTQHQPYQDILKQVIDAIVNHYPIELQYVKMTEGADLERRRVLPFQLDTSGHRWDVHAIDADRQAVRTFVLARIESAQPLHARALSRKLLDSMEGMASTMRDRPLEVEIDVRLSPRLSAYQAEAIRKELGISAKSNRRSIPRRRYYELRRLYSEAKTEDGMAWSLAELKRTDGKV